MILDLLRLLGGPLLAAGIGGLIVHFATRRRDAENEQRRQRVDYLLKAYRTLTHSTHRDLSGKPTEAEAFENALSDVVLFGNAEQIRLARKVVSELASGGRASLDELLVSFRTALRQELKLKADDLRQVPVIRFGGLDAHTPLSVAESWSVKKDKTEAAVVAAVTASATARGSAHNPSVHTVNFTGIDELRDLARAAPGAAVVAAYGKVRLSLLGLLDAEQQDERDAPELAREAATRGLIGNDTIDSVDGLAIMKNLSRAGRAGTGLTVEKADDYIELVAAILYVLGRAQPNRQQAS